MQGKLKEQVNDFFTRDAVATCFETLFFCRADGHQLFFHNNSEMQIAESSVGALSVGAWDAVSAIVSMISKTKGTEDFRFSFDTSSQGIYLLTINVSKQKYYLGTIYSNETNPGALKLRLRNLSTRLESYMTDLNLMPSREIAEKEENYLFKNISDDEINRLFESIGGSDVVC